MKVSEVKKFLEACNDEQEFIIEMVPNFKMSVKPLPEPESKTDEVEKAA